MYIATLQTIAAKNAQNFSENYWIAGIHEVGSKKCTYYVWIFIFVVHSVHIQYLTRSFGSGTRLHLHSIVYIFPEHYLYCTVYCTVCTYTRWPEAALHTREIWEFATFCSFVWIFEQRTAAGQNVVGWTRQEKPVADGVHVLRL